MLFSFPASLWTSTWSWIDFNWFSFNCFDAHFISFQVRLRSPGPNDESLLEMFLFSLIFIAICCCVLRFDWFAWDELKWCKLWNSRSYLKTVLWGPFIRFFLFVAFVCYPLANTRGPEFHAIELHLLQWSFLQACPNPTVPSMIRCSEGARKRESRRYAGFCWAATDKLWSFWVLISCLGERLPKTCEPSSKWCFVHFFCDKIHWFFIDFWAPPAPVSSFSGTAKSTAIAAFKQPLFRNPRRYTAMKTQTNRGPLTKT